MAILWIIVIIASLAGVIIYEKKYNKKEIDYTPKDLYDVNYAKQILNENGYEVKKKKYNSGCLWALSIVIVGMFFVFWIIGKTSQPINQADHRGNVNEILLAYNYAETFVKEKLKSPSSAIFPNSQKKVEDTEYKGDNTYYINSEVESMNSFGAMVKTKFTCTIVFKDKEIVCNDITLY